MKPWWHNDVAAATDFRYDRGARAAAAGQNGSSMTAGSSASYAVETEARFRK